MQILLGTLISAKHMAKHVGPFKDSGSSVQSFASHCSKVLKKSASGAALPGLPEDLSKLKRLLMKTILAPAF